MNNEQILEDAISVGAKKTTRLVNYTEDTYVLSVSQLTKFAELTKQHHEMQSFQTIADIRELLGVGHLPMMTELPALIKKELTINRAAQWIDCSVELPIINKTGNWNTSKRCVVVVDRGHEKYEAFANLTKYIDLDAEWVIDGHNGNWHKNVTHWLPLPPNAQQERT